jgi:predicted enzyme related to lactoylglutathione lyase
MTTGKIVWREHISPDPSLAIPFYEALLGWKTEPVDMGSPDSPYPMVRIDGKQVTGFDTSDGSDAPPHWLVYITVPDSVEAATERALTAGGSVVREPQPLHDFGRYAVLRDPDGAVFCVFASSQPDSSAAEEPWPPALGTVSWYAIAGSDLGATARFYADVCEYDQPDPTEEFSVINTPILTVGSRLHAGVLPASSELPAQWLVYVVVPDADAILTRSIELGGKPITPVMAIPQIGRIIGITDPAGATFFAHEPERS